MLSCLFLNLSKAFSVSLTATMVKSKAYPHFAVPLITLFLKDLINTFVLILLNFLMGTILYIDMIYINSLTKIK